MKANIKYISMAVASVLTLSACSDQFLQDKKNYDNATSDIYNYYEGADGRLNDLYAWSLPDNGDVSWKIPSMGNADMCARSTEEYNGFYAKDDKSNPTQHYWVSPVDELSTMASAGAANSVPDFFMGTQNNIQQAVYGRIRNINDFLAHMESCSLTEAEKEELCGQAYFLRAWSYFNLFKWYGGVPIVTTIIEPVPGIEVPARASAKATKDFILSDLDKAAKMLAAKTMDGGWSGSDYGRVTTGTALALKGRVLQWWCSPLFNRNPGDETRWKEAYAMMKQELDSIKACGYGLYSSTNNVNGSDFALQFLQSNKNPEAVFVRLFNNVTGDGLDNQKNNRWERDIRPANTGGGGKGASSMLIDLFPMADGKIAPSVGAVTYTKLEKSAYDYNPTNFDSDGTTGIPFLNRDPRFYRTFAMPGFRWAYNGNASEINANNPSDGKNYVLWNYVWYTKLDDQGNPESGNSYGADNLLSSKQNIYVRKKSDDLDVNGSALYNYVAADTKGSAPFYSAAQLIELRYAEVLLNLAEVACMAGYPDEAAGYLQQVRDRAGVPAYSNLSDKATCMSAILYERQIELAYEGKRFDDMRRWLLYDGGTQFSTISGAPSTWTLQGEITNTCTWLGFKQFNGQRRENVEFRCADKYGVGGTTYDSDPMKNVTRPDGLDLRQDISTQQTTLAQWYTDNLVIKQRSGDERDSQHNLLYANYRPKYYFLGFPIGVMSANKTMPQTIGWEDYNNGGAMGTFDPLAE